MARRDSYMPVIWFRWKTSHLAKDTLLSWATNPDSYSSLADFSARTGGTFRRAPKRRSVKKSGVGRIRMIGRTVSVLLLAAACLQRTMAQPTDDGLDATQKHGRQLLAQSCGVCHLPPALGARTYGPQLSRETAGGNDDVIRGIISDGTPRMPGF